MSIPRWLIGSIVLKFIPTPGQIKSEVNLGKMREITFKNIKINQPERTFVFISIITGRATPP
jgi:hypothetical protein